ncbi:MAG: hypothetical protein K0R31_209 [Clostridiales bacterium]|jgi:hypothetical protein|nr:hypothetical protein [Clostridiales bacterium]
MLIVVIGMFRENVDIIQAAAQRVNDSDKVRNEIVVPLNKGEVMGSDVVSAIRYYSSDPDVQIKVTLIGGNSKVFNVETYNADTFKISYESRFTASYAYDESKKVIGVVYIEK